MSSDHFYSTTLFSFREGMSSLLLFQAISITPQLSKSIPGCLPVYPSPEAMITQIIRSQIAEHRCLYCHPEVGRLLERRVELPLTNQNVSKYPPIPIKHNGTRDLVTPNAAEFCRSRSDSRCAHRIPCELCSLPVLPPRE